MAHGQICPLVCTVLYSLSLDARVSLAAILRKWVIVKLLCSLEQYSYIHILYRVKVSTDSYTRVDEWQMVSFTGSQHVLYI